MRIPTEVLKCVCFVGYQLASGERCVVGTAFFLGRSVVGSTFIHVAVTARHVIEGMRRQGIETVLLKVNLKDGGSLWTSTPIEEWYLEAEDYSPDVAVAIGFGFSEDWDHLVLLEGLLLSKTAKAFAEVGPGDDVFAVGFFSKHHDENKNWPVVRMGNIAALDVSGISTRYGPREGHLIETRSIGGLSGSPVFLKSPDTKWAEGRVQYRTGGNPFHLFGLVHGHFDERFEQEFEQGRPERQQPISINLGIAVVVPIADIVRIIESCLTARQVRVTFVALPEL